MRWKPHVRFGGRAEETDQPKRRHRASARSNHTHATLGLAAGVHVKVMSDRLGHATTTFTQDIYMHAIPAVEDDAADQIAGLVFGAEPNVETTTSTDEPPDSNDEAAS